MKTHVEKNKSLFQLFFVLQSQHQGGLGLAQTNALNCLNLESRMYRGFSGGVCNARLVPPQHQEAGGGGLAKLTCRHTGGGRYHWRLCRGP